MPKPKDVDPHGHELVHRLRALVVQLDLLGAEFAHLHGLHATDVRALISLLDSERAGHRATPGWLGQQLGLNSASVTALVDRMERNELVARRRDARDRRRVIVEVSDTAKELGWSFFGPLISHAVVATQDFSPEQVDTIDSFLSSMIAAVETTRRGQTRTTDGWSRRNT
ncbi:MAG: MarR family winged helix-turn-helix transcriptional regulator [Rhodococcus sp. (in: high G+C Gram-positive bacteria)]|uniref:MarR family winged helix-turn-helix transcriptional regulator n=1 Tax=Rhodococcus sp. TaxID=1831 RepID=UPI003BB18184